MSKNCSFALQWCKRVESCQRTSSDWLHMAHYRVQRSSLKGKITIPPSKSQTLRAILLAAMAQGKSTIHHPLNSPDTRAMITACRLLGAEINDHQTYLEIKGVNGLIKHAEDVIQAGNSGIVLRFISAVAALSHQPIVITGDYSIRHSRPMLPLLKGLHQLGASAISTRGDGFAPIVVQGPLKSGKAIIGGEDSQPVSALLIASVFGSGPIEIEVQNPGEKPWVDLTLDWLDRLGVKCERRNYEYYRLSGQGKYKGFEYTVPGDWSSAAFPLAAALITDSELTVRNVDFNDKQGDKELLNVFRKMGAKLEINSEKCLLHVCEGSFLKGIDIDINDFVDALPILATVACFAKGETRIRNAAVAAKKECNRIQCIAAELSKMNARITVHNDGLSIMGSELKGAQVLSHDDHRMAMSLAVAGMGAKGMTEVQNVDCVEKTFPSFVDSFLHLGTDIEVCS